MRKPTFALLLILLISLCAIPAVAQTPVASPSAADIDALCGTVQSDATPTTETFDPAIDLSAVSPDQIVLDALHPTLATTNALTEIIAVRSKHPPMVELALEILPIQADWLTQTDAIREQYYAGKANLNPAQIAQAFAMATSASPGMGGTSGLEPLTSEHQLESLRDLCAESLEPDLVFIDHMVAQYSGLLVLTGFAMEHAQHPETVALATTIQGEVLAELDQFNLWRQTWFPNAPFQDDHAGDWSPFSADCRATPAPECQQQP